MGCVIIVNVCGCFFVICELDELFEIVCRNVYEWYY